MPCPVETRGFHQAVVGFGWRFFIVQFRWNESELFDEHSSVIESSRFYSEESGCLLGLYLFRYLLRLSLVPCPLLTECLDRTVLFFQFFKYFLVDLAIVVTEYIVALSLSDVKDVGILEQVDEERSTKMVNGTELVFGPVWGAC